MASSVKFVRVPPNSANLAEARQRVFEFFKTACRSIPSIMEIYNLDDVASPSQLRSAVASEIRKNAHLTNSKVIDVLLFKGAEELNNVNIYFDIAVIDMLLFKGTEELNNIVEHSKQRHHIIGQYVIGRHGLTHDIGIKDGESDFVKNFYKGNYF